MTKSDIFWKCWWWAAVAGAGAAIFFLLLTAIPIFSGVFRVVPFVDTLVILSVIGCYFGAGYVGSRIAAKYYGGEGKYARRYIRLSVISFALLVAVAFSPLSFLMVLWSFIAPLCALLTINALTPKAAKATHKARSTTRARAAH